MPGYLVPDDAEHIANYLQLSLHDILHMFAASPGAVVARMENGQIVVGRIPTIVPAQQPNGHCIFLQADGLCSIHPVAPYGCAVVDSHMSQQEGEKRSSRGLIAILRSEPYQDLWNTLYEAGQITVGPEAKRKMSEAAMNDLTAAAIKKLEPALIAAQKGNHEARS